jgi:DASS family divalent anion:Na+ symporter
MKVCYQANVITSALFLTAMAANPLIVKLSGDIGVKITWTSWALMMIVPGIFCLVLMPLLVYFIYPPTIKHSEEAPIVARKKLEEMGPIGINEVVMMLTFILLVTLWIIGADYGISATATAAIGLSILFVTRAIKFDDAVSDKTAWHTFMWFATLVMLSGYLTKFGIMEVMGTKIASMLPVGQPIFAISILMLIYFFSHIFFASSTAHITVFFPTFLIVLLNLGMAPMVAAMSLGSLSILSGGITHFGLASAPIFFGANYLKTKTWWSIGFVCSLLYLLVLATVGLMWWKILGYM